MIIAQIAFTALSLDNISRSHWTAYVAFIMSLVSGCLSVYVSCSVQALLSGLHGNQEIYEWLTAVKNHKRRPSANAAMLLVIPSHLLLLSLAFFLVGFGIYLGLMYTRHLPETVGKGTALAILVFYICATCWFTSLYGYSYGMKSIEELLDDNENAQGEEEMRSNRRNVDGLASSGLHAPRPPNWADITNSLEATLAAQQILLQSLRAQQTQS